MLLKDKVAVVTGAAEGIGEGVARLFASEGAMVHLFDRSAEANEAVASSIRAQSGAAQAFAGDVRDDNAIRACVEAARRHSGHIDILINNAGIYPRQDFVDMTERQWDEMQDINLKGMFRWTKAVIPRMLSQGSGKIVNISSVLFFVGPRNLAHYAASKGGIIGLTRALAREMGEKNIHVNCITPGAILVESEKKVATEEQVREVVALQSLKRRLLPLDVARVCLFLSSPLSDGMTGQTLNVDGGWIMH